MNTPADPDTLVGDIMKVMSIDLSQQAIHVILQNGKSAKVTLNSEKLPSCGDIILVGENFWDMAPHDMWMTSNSIAIVRRIINEQVLIVDDGLSLKQIRNRQKIDVSVNNTIEYNDFDGIVSVLAEKPIRSRDHEVDRDELLKEYLVDTSGEGPSFEDFGGYPYVIQRARELIETQFKSRDNLNKIGARPLKGVLFSGPPGTGKTHLARIIAHSTKADFYLISGPSIVSKWVGDTEDTLRKIFDAAISSKSGRAIIFFDEIDSIAERRSGETHEASKRLVAQLLTLMDGFEENSKSVIVIAATNRAETLDPALMRPGRFDWEIEFGTPTTNDRFEILQVAAKRLQTRGDLPFYEVAVLTEGWSAAELTSLWSEAALLAAGDDRAKIAAEDMVQAYERIAQRPKHLESFGGKV
ncbi:MAG: 26S protease regulatory subunit [Mariprofundaceae bacterium]|nr:26S protease regulatory subunit [Mariprofundaceae bacterium]